MVGMSDILKLPQWLMERSTSMLPQQHDYKFSHEMVSDNDDNSDSVSGI